ncbi:hypothetical protein WICMUC_005313 [Wickerhamomyces mucosus]|uniref:diphosphoinositol-polyphosphate diphosphatase n=1 Tax=Wickerhamomyces mucosus TaxID=1378264 RepID=A0A9P8P9T2_9ASCO|nr:hypothetical protein WICMUC_005313 [Wickerhamomyces mucosus]
MEQEFPMDLDEANIPNEEKDEQNNHDEYTIANEENENILKEINEYKTAAGYVPSSFQASTSSFIDRLSLLNDNDEINLSKLQELTIEEELQQRFHNHSVIPNEIDYLSIRSKLATPQPFSVIKPLLSSPSNDISGDSIGEELLPPENFSPVIKDIYRSSFPRPENFEFLSKLGLRSILILIPEEYPPENLQFLEHNKIKVFQVGMSGNKEPFVNVPHNVITQALEVAINPDNQPLLIHCNRGKHRTGCLVGCIRRLQNWSLTMIFDEYRRFAAPKARPLDQQFIEMYDSTEISTKAHKEGWLPLQW